MNLIEVTFNGLQNLEPRRYEADEYDFHEGWVHLRSKEYGLVASLRISDVTAIQYVSMARVNG